MTDEFRRAISSALDGIKQHHEAAVTALGVGDLETLGEEADMIETDTRDLLELIAEAEEAEE